ncbi:MAG: PDZ domain-containing protein [bacterium]|nr:PDZ domain-containing protein [bacterium]
MIRPLTTKPWLASLALVALALTLSVSVALADDGKTVKVRTIVLTDDDAAGGDENLRVEVKKEDGKTHLKVWKVEDGKEVLVEDRELGDEEALKVAGRSIIVLDGEDVALGDEEYKFFKRGDGDEDFWAQLGEGDATWTAAGGGAWLGVQVRELGEQLGAYFGAKDGGALVESVVEDSPAAKAGFQAGDVILTLGGEPVADPDDVITTVRGMAKGDQLEAKVLRKGKEMTLKAELAEREGGAAVVRSLGMAPHAMQMRKFRSGGPEHEEIRRLHRELAPGTDEIENLHADIAELRAMIDELREKMAQQK